MGEFNMTYVHDKKKSKIPQSKVLDRGFGISNDDKKRAVATDYVIDTNKRDIKDKVNKSEPKMTE